MPRPRTLSPRPRKSLGQHFLRDGGVLGDIAAAVRVPAGGVVVEVGAGTGQLTEALLARGLRVVALEIEARLVGHLERRFAEASGLVIIQADARDTELERLVAPGTPYSVVGNLPYFAANPIIRRFLEERRQPHELVVMVQREVAAALAARPGDCSLLSIGVQVYAQAERLFDVPPVAFDPPPKVHSTVVRLSVRPFPLVPANRIEAFFRLASATFRNPRKQIHNALCQGSGLSAEAAQAALAVAAIDPMRRAETLTIAEWLALLDARETVLANG